MLCTPWESESKKYNNSNQCETKGKPARSIRKSITYKEIRSHSFKEASRGNNVTNNGVKH